MGYPLPGKLYKALFKCFAVSLLAAMTLFVCPDQVVQAQNITSSTVQNAAPVLAFADSALSVNESSSLVFLPVKLLEAGNSAVSVDLYFVSGSSTASSQDIRGFSNQTVNFTTKDTSGTVRSIPVELSNDEVYQGRKRAVFRLQNNTSGRIISPQVLTLTIVDNDTPNIVINEIFADAQKPARDMLTEESLRVSEADFIELVNNESVDVDISGWVLSGQKGLSYKFPQNTVIEAGRAFVLFNDTVPAGNFGGARLLTVQGMDLPVDGDTIVLSDPRENTIYELTYSDEAGAGQSLNRQPGEPGEFVRHATIQGSYGKRCSPGMKWDGTSFGSGFATGIRGEEGWHMIASPTRGTTFKDLFQNLWTQGSTGSSAPAQEPTIYTWSEEAGGSFSPITDMNRELDPGKGYMIYVFEDDQQQSPGIQGGFPKFIRTDDSENTGTVTIRVTAGDHNGNGVIDGMEGWNLVGNPYGAELSVDALLNAFESVDPNVNANLMVWEPSAGSGNGAYIPLSSGDAIAPFQAFWVRYTNASGVEGTVTLSKGDLISGSRNQESLTRRNGAENYGLTLSLGDGSFSDKYRLEFRDSETSESDRFNVFKLNSMKPDAIALYGISGANRLAKNVVPLELDAYMELPVGFDAQGRSSLQLDWQGLDRLPDYWDIRLIDRALDKEIDLRAARNYRFTIQGTDIRNESEQTTSKLKPKKTDYLDTEPRFLLAVSTGQVAESETVDIPETVKLNPNYPNPFNPTTTISYELKEEAQVLLSIWNIVGQKVVTLVDGMKEAGEHTASWNASDMPSGLYIAQLEVGGEVFIRKMTLIK